MRLAQPSRHSTRYAPSGRRLVLTFPNRCGLPRRQTVDYSQLFSWSVVTPCCRFVFVSSPDGRGAGLESALLATAEQQARTILRAEGAHPFTLFAQATGSNPALQQALLHAGFVMVSTFEKMELVLAEPPAVPQAIASIAIRPFVAGQDREAIYHADEEAFADERGYAPRTFAQWNRRLTMRERTNEPPVWMIAWDATEVAGAALGEVINGVGWIHHVGVRRHWRMQGLGTALTLASTGGILSAEHSRRAPECRCREPDPCAGTLPPAGLPGTGHLR